MILEIGLFVIGPPAAACGSVNVSNIAILRLKITALRGQFHIKKNIYLIKGRGEY